MVNNKSMNKFLILLLISIPLFSLPYEKKDISSGAQYEVGFSHKKGSTAQDIVLEAIHSAKVQILLAAYSFTSIPIINALIEAKNNGVQVKVVLSENGNMRKDKSINKNSNIPFLVEYHIPFHIVPKKKYSIMHNKFMVIDHQIIETGSFNYTKNADKNNAENVITLYNTPDIAKKYECEFDKLWREGYSLLNTSS